MVHDPGDEMINASDARSISAKATSVGLTKLNHEIDEGIRRVASIGGHSFLAKRTGPTQPQG
jgi:hypothetical protein